ncbi:MAG: zinc chelation protein SecC [Gammaproteobacteria bacterium]|nr:zinc chelation protein SecC [Gammaproteobacteria bacterium]
MNNDKTAALEHVHGPECHHDHDHAHSHQALAPARNPLRTVGRNDPCPCGSGKKFKKCHAGAAV